MKEAVDQTLQTAKENQKIVKEGKKWLKTLYEALKEKHPHRSYEKEDEADVDTDDNYIKNRNYGNYLDNSLWKKINLKAIHRDMSSAYFFLIVDLRERGTLLQQKNGSKKSQAQKIRNILQHFITFL